MSGSTQTPEEPILAVEDLRTYFYTRQGVVKAVDGVDLAVAPGRTLCIVGESGCGKSMTALSILRLVDRPGKILAGSKVMFGGTNLATASERYLKRVRGSEISMIFQEPMMSLNPVYTVGSQIVEAIRLHERTSQRAAARRAVEMMELVGIHPAAKRYRDYPHSMSGGMQQRIMIAIALACSPSILIADEPTTALDVTIQAQILDLLRDLRDRLNMAIVLITHDMGVVAEMADDVAVMYAGRVVEYGAVARVLSTPQHPYTRALLRSIPRLGMNRDEALAVIPGSVPNPRAWPSGCRFAPRCEFVFDRCRVEDPPLQTSAGHAAACWLADAVAGQVETGHA